MTFEDYINSFLTIYTYTLYYCSPTIFMRSPICVIKYLQLSRIQIIVLMYPFDRRTAFIIAYIFFVLFLGIKKTRRRITVSTEHNRTTHKRCKTFENRRGGNIFRKAEEVLAENLPENDGVCFFVQIPGKHPKWTAKPVCYRRSRNRVRVQ